MIIITVKCMVSDFGSYIYYLLHIIMYNPWTVKMFNSANVSFIEQITSLGWGFKTTITLIALSVFLRLNEYRRNKSLVIN